MKQYNKYALINLIKSYKDVNWMIYIIKLIFGNNQLKTMIQMMITNKKLF